MSKAVLNMIMDATDKQLSTESLSHIAAALNITVSGTHNVRFKLRAAIRSHTKTINAAEEGFRSSASMADFFSSFESHQKPVLLSIAALHRIDISERVTVDSLRTQITQHILSGHCSQFSQSHPRIPLPNGLSLPDCANVHNEWQFNSLDGDFQAHILTAIHGSNAPLRSLLRMLSLLTVDYGPEDSIGRLRRRLKDFIVSLRRDKKVERSREQEHAACEKAREEHAKELQRVREMWPQVLPQSMKESANSYVSGTNRF
jgi:hypothetical protein